VVADGLVRETIDRYLRALERAASDDLLERVDRDDRGYEKTLVQRVEIRDASGGRADIVVAGRSATISVQVTKSLPGMHCRLTILNSLGQPVTTLDSEVFAPTDVRDPKLGSQLECEIPSLPLLPGRYRIDVLLKANRVIQDGLQAAAFFDVEPGVLGDRPIPAAGSGSDGTVALAHMWRLPS
jgi:lipopolysaccharide transport system ATP-binding protein